MVAIEVVTVVIEVVIVVIEVVMVSIVSIEGESADFQYYLDYSKGKFPH